MSRLYDNVNSTCDTADTSPSFEPVPCIRRALNCRKGIGDHLNRHVARRADSFGPLPGPWIHTTTMVRFVALPVVPVTQLFMSRKYDIPVPLSCLPHGLSRISK